MRQVVGTVFSVFAAFAAAGPSLAWGIGPLGLFDQCGVCRPVALAYVPAPVACAAPQPCPPLVRFRAVSQIQYTKQRVVRTVPKTVYQTVTMDEGHYELVWVSKPVTRRVPRVVYEQQVFERLVPYRVTRLVPEWAPCGPLVSQADCLPTSTASTLGPSTTWTHSVPQTAAAGSLAPGLSTTVAGRFGSVAGNAQSAGSSGAARSSARTTTPTSRTRVGSTTPPALAARAGTAAAAYDEDPAPLGPAFARSTDKLGGYVPTTTPTRAGVGKVAEPPRRVPSAIAVWRAQARSRLR